MGSYYAGKTVLITGAAGFLGSHLTERLTGEGARVVGIDNLSFARPDQPSSGGSGQPARIFGTPTFGTAPPYGR